MSTVAVAFAPSQVRPQFHGSSWNCWERETWAAIIVSYLTETGMGWSEIPLTGLVAYGHRSDHPEWDRLLFHEQGRMLAGLRGLVLEGYLSCKDTDTRYVAVQQPLFDFYRLYL